MVPALPLPLIIVLPQIHANLAGVVVGFLEFVDGKADGRIPVLRSLRRVLGFFFSGELDEVFQDKARYFLPLSDFPRISSGPMSLLTVILLMWFCTLLAIQLSTFHRLNIFFMSF